MNAEAIITVLSILSLVQTVFSCWLLSKYTGVASAAQKIIDRNANQVFADANMQHQLLLAKYSADLCELIARNAPQVADKDELIQGLCKGLNDNATYFEQEAAISKTKALTA